MFGISLNKNLLDLVHNKDVVLVGPAPYLIDSSRGLEFDSADIIVRPNEIIPPKNLRKDYGSRTDILFCNFGTPWMPGIKRKITLDDHEQHFKNLKLVVGSAIKADHSEGNFLSWPDEYISDVPSNFQNINKYNLPFYWIGVPDYKKIYSNVGVEFNTGIAAAVILLSYPIKSLKIAGFTFYTGGNSYKELYYEGHMDEDDIKGRSFGFSSGHGEYANLKQVDFFKQLCHYKSDLIKLDKQIKDIIML